MPARTSAPARDLDYTNIGKVGRRTGITLPPRKRDEHGLEEMTGLFSSPEKPVSRDVFEPSGTLQTATPSQHAQPRTPTTAASVRRSVRTSARSRRSGSPRKSGISGTARRNGTIDVLAQAQPPRSTRKEREDDVPATVEVTEEESSLNEAEIEQASESELAQLKAAKVAREEVEVEVTEGESSASEAEIDQNSRAASGQRTTNTATTKEVGEGQIESDPEPERVQQNNNKVLSTTPTQAAKSKSASTRPATVRRFSPERTPLRNHVMRSKSAYVPRVSDIHSAAEEAQVTEDVSKDTPTRANSRIMPEENTVDRQVEDLGDVPQVDLDSYEDKAVNEALETPANNIDLSDESDEEPEPPPLPPIIDDEEEDETFDPSTLNAQLRGQNKANSRRKRKSELMEEDRRAQSSPAAKRAKRRDEVLVPKASDATHSRSSKSKPARFALSKMDKNTQLSQRQRQGMEEVVEKIRARPGAKKSLMLLRRETPVDDTVGRTRSGRVTIKPVAWWRNEGVVYDAGDGAGAGIGDGWRMPLTSIKEVIRQDKIATPRLDKRKNKKKGQKRQRQQQEESDVSEPGQEDPDLDDWERDTGTLTASMGIWDPELQGCADEEEEMDIAHSAEAIETREVKGQGFKYAKLVSQTFFGTGIVDVPPGAVKRAKNSRKMHMSFFVFKGRVTVQMGPIQGPETRFSIGKGGFWHVPRGNNYSIENEHDKEARIFFSQACDTAALIDQEDV